MTFLEEYRALGNVQQIEDKAQIDGYIAFVMHDVERLKAIKSAMDEAIKELEGDGNE